MFDLLNLGFGYDNKNMIFSGVNVHLKKGETLSILGPNGVGKTTLLKCALGFLKPCSGNILVDGKNSKSLKTKEFWKKISYVPQAKQLNFPYSVMDMVLMGRASSVGFASKPTKEDKQLSEEAMELVGVHNLKDKCSNQISGGELQLVLIARAIVSQPDIMILDEPESNLDMRNQLMVLQVLEKLKEEKKMTAVINTHYPNHALKISEKSLLMGYDGCHKIGQTNDVITGDNIKKYFQVESHFVKISGKSNCKCHKVFFPTDICSCCKSN